jgi:4-hydroxy-tetrahydrodipicolinate reductase
MKNVILSGMMGRMGSMIAVDVIHMKRANLVGSIVASDEVDEARDFLASNGVMDLPVSSDAQALLDSVSKADVYLDFSIMRAVESNLKLAAKKRIPSIIGVSGFAEEDYDWMRSIAVQNNVPILLVPNFSIGILLIKKMVELARRYYQRVEIIEAHHDQKRDAPSGTSLDIAMHIAKIEPPPSPFPPIDEVDMGSRGFQVKDVHVHSLRIPGIIAEQTIIFGAPGEQLSISHRTTSRDSFLAGIYYAIDHVGELKGFNIGLESVLQI